jgi:hypothetical protein
MERFQFVIKVLLLIVADLFCTNEVRAESFTITKSGKELLSSFFPETSRYFVTELKIIGEINTSDISFIRSIAKGDGNLSDLDLSDVVFVDADSLGHFIEYNNIKDGREVYPTLAQQFKGIPYVWHEASPYASEHDVYHNTYLGYYIVYKETGLGYVKFNTIQYTGLDVIPNHMFRGCDKLKTVILPPHVTSIGNYAFYECKNLIKVSIPANVTKIGDYAFKGCVKLQEIELPQALTSIGSSVFDGCTTLSSIVIPDNVKTMGSYIFQNCTGLKSAKLTDNLETVPWGLFYKCKNLKSANIPQNCTKIDTYSFDGCALDSVIIPKSVKQIDASAFSCPFGHGVYAMPEMPPSYGNKNSWKSVTLYVPKGCVERYSLSPGWKEFGKILEMPELNNKKCEKPTISYKNNELVFSSGTEDVSFVSTISDTDIKTYSSNKIVLSATYKITVYAKRNGYEDSEIATATLCWIDVDPKTEGLSNDVAQVRANAVLLQAENGHITITGVNDGTIISVFDINGIQVGLTTSRNGQANIPTNLRSGSIAIIKIGDRSVKVAIK